MLETVFPDGASDITVQVSDGVAAPATCSTRVTVQDTKPPVIESLNAIPATLWPPNHRMAHVQVKVNASDACGPVASKVISVRSNEPVNGTGDGNTAPDWAITGELTVDLRAERAGPGNGRIYTIEVEVTDAAGNKVTRETTVRAGQALVHWRSAAQSANRRAALVKKTRPRFIARLPWPLPPGRFA